MFAAVRNNRTDLQALLAAVIVLAMASSAMTYALCPHVSASSISCEQQTISHHAHAHHGAVRQISHASTRAGRALTQPETACPYCTLHAQSDPNATSQTARTTSSSHTASAPELVATLAPTPQSPVAVVDAHQHGPPGTRDPRYVLNHTYRI